MLVMLTPPGMGSDRGAAGIWRGRFDGGDLERVGDRFARGLTGQGEKHGYDSRGFHLNQ